MFSAKPTFESQSEFRLIRLHVEMLYIFFKIDERFCYFWFLFYNHFAICMYAQRKKKFRCIPKGRVTKVFQNTEKLCPSKAANLKPSSEHTVHCDEFRHLNCSCLPITFKTCAHVFLKLPLGRNCKSQSSVHVTRGAEQWTGHAVPIS